MPAWLIPSLDIIPAGGSIRSVGEHSRRDYHRAYYHAKRRGRKQAYSTAQQERRREQRAALYRANLDRERANARARYWRHRDEYAAASRLRRAKRGT